ncbi:hypothetical protein [Mycobacterium sp. NPDC050853]|uniref:hypothetical protein n=1 Tax=Mycobacterium sp. NPDC050853 TaxID=3155160 RepID=UPI0033D440C9
MDQNNGISIYNSAAPQPSQAAQPSQAPVQNQDGTYNRAANGEQQPINYNNAPNNQQLNSDWQQLSDQLNNPQNQQAQQPGQDNGRPDQTDDSDHSDTCSIEGIPDLVPVQNIPDPVPIAPPSGIGTGARLVSGTSRLFAPTSPGCDEKSTQTKEISREQTLQDCTGSAPGPFPAGAEQALQDAITRRNTHPMPPSEGTWDRWSPGIHPPPASGPTHNQDEALRLSEKFWDFGLPRAELGLNNYILGGGVDQPLDVQALIADVPEFSQKVNSTLDQYVRDLAKSNGLKPGQTITPSQGCGFSTDWNVFSTPKKAHPDWFLLLGSFSLRIRGNVSTIEMTRDGQLNYQASFIVDAYDVYDFNPNANGTVNDLIDLGLDSVYDLSFAQLAGMNDTGEARVYREYGSGPLEAVARSVSAG